MDLLNYDPAIPELPLLRGVRLQGGEPPPRFDWGGSVIRLAQVMARRSVEGRQD